MARDSLGDLNLSEQDSGSEFGAQRTEGGEGAKKKNQGGKLGRRVICEIYL